jgi:ribosomal protein L3 glutamine methyltransferase
MARFPAIPFVWLDFEYGGEGVLLLDQAQLVEYRPVFEAAASGQ